MLVGGGEFIRRTGFQVPVEGAAGAYVPGILTAAGAFTLFGAVYAAHGIYGFIGPALAFALMGIIGVGTIAAALVHGQALAGIGLLGSMITPVLVSSQSPNAWALFGYLAIVLVANTVIARMRDWKFLAAAGFVGAGLWCLLYLSDAAAVDLTVVMFTNAVTLGALAFVWLGRRADGATASGDGRLAVDRARLLRRARGDGAARRSGLPGRRRRRLRRRPDRRHARSSRSIGRAACRCFTRRALRPCWSMRRQRSPALSSLEFSGGELAIERLPGIAVRLGAASGRNSRLPWRSSPLATGRRGERSL